MTYGTKGDHGGHNRLVQNIPMIFSGPGVGSRDSYRPMRLVDVLPTVLDGSSNQCFLKHIHMDSSRLRTAKAPT